MSILKNELGLIGILAAMGVGSDIPGLYAGGYKSKDLLDGVDIDAEYLLIQDKKSKLSANLRKRVVYIVEAVKIMKEKNDEVMDTGTETK